MQKENTHRVVCFGEVLWDILPSGSVPGGAPMNVAYHLNQLSKNPAIITKIGSDEKGKGLLQIFSASGVCTDFIQTDYEYETGKVYAKPNEHNEVVYDILMPVAWDFINWQEGLAGLVEQADYFVFGSLAARNKASRDTLFRLLEMAKYKVLDINLRAPHYNRRIVEELLQKADLIKMNQAELELITGWFSQHTGIEERIQSLRDKFNISTMVVTMGGDGALLYMDDQITINKGFKITVVDTVGSGDAFLAGLLSKLLEKASREAALEFACALGAFIATQRGACPEYRLESIEKLMGEQKIKSY